MEEPAEQHSIAVASFAFELSVLKRMRRVGWWPAGVRDPESVAEHSLRVAQLTSLIAAIQGADPSRAALLAVWHDSQETRTAKDADKLECLLQAIEYQEAGYSRVQGWIDSRNGIRTDTARRIADATLLTSPLAWRDR